MNIKMFLQQNGIKVWDSGENVSKGHINIKCLFCDDDFNHLGINLKTLKCNCWRCGKKHISKIIMRVLNCPYGEAKSIVKSFDIALLINDKKYDLNQSDIINLPEGASKKFPNKALRYLESRGFNPKYLIKKYDLYYCNFANQRYKFRIVIPIYMDHKLISFTCRDITDIQTPKYKTATNKDAIRSAIFNYDNIEKFGNAILVEGPMDAMKLGDGAFSCLGVSITPEREKLIAKKCIENLYILYDNDKTGIRKSEENESILENIVKRIHIMKLKGINDPAELTFDRVLQLRSHFGFSIDKGTFY